MYEQTKKHTFESVEGDESQSGSLMHHDFATDTSEYAIWPTIFPSAEFQEAFNLFDNRGDGKIQQQQIGECLRALGQNPTESDVKKFTHQLKPDDRISFEVFLPIYQVRLLSG